MAYKIMNWTITKRKKHNLDEEYYNVDFGNISIRFEVDEARHFIQDFDDQVNHFGR